MGTIRNIVANRHLYFTILVPRHLFRVSYENHIDTKLYGKTHEALYHLSYPTRVVVSEFGHFIVKFLPRIDDHQLGSGSYNILPDAPEEPRDCRLRRPIG